MAVALAAIGEYIWAFSVTAKVASIRLTGNILILRNRKVFWCALRFNHKFCHIIKSFQSYNWTNYPY
jgi:hypothetical protein